MADIRERIDAVHEKLEEAKVTPDINTVVQVVIEGIQDVLKILTDLHVVK